MHAVAETVLGHVRREELFRAGDRVGVAVSGGGDSVALLRLLLELRHELGIVLSVVHFNHRLRGAQSDADQAFVEGLAREHGLESHVGGEDVARYAQDARVSTEAAARELRYAFFRRLIGSVEDESPLLPKPRRSGAPAEVKIPSLSQEALGQGWGGSRLDKIATAHTLDDQAETVLMRVIRGTGIRGLGGIHPRIVVEDADVDVSGEIIRPLLGIRRCELQQYLAEIKQPWREDASNADVKFTRNRVRQAVLPLLEREFNPAMAENLAELAEIARGEEDYWENEVSGWLGTVVQWQEPEWAQSKGVSGALVKIGSPAVENPGNESAPPVMNAQVSRAWLLTEPLAVQRRLVKAIGETAGIPLEFKHVEEVLRFASESGPGGKELSLPMGWRVVRKADSVIFAAPDPRKSEQIPKDYEYELTVPGRAMVLETCTVIEALRVGPEEMPGYNREHFLDPDLLCERLRVRNWRPGDRFWPAHTKSPKKIKELLAERHVAAVERRTWPVAVSGDNIVWVRGFPVPTKLQAKAGRSGVLIQETSWAEEPVANE